MNLKKVVKYLEVNNDLLVRQIILDKAQKDEQIIYGTRALNRQVPTPLKRETVDYDILTKKPKKSAQQLVEELNRRLGKEEFKVAKAKHRGTFKIKDASGKTVADYTQLKRIPSTKTSWGNKVKDLSSIKKSITRSLKKPGNEFRKPKDTDALNRIKISEEMFNF